uniref:Exonuclease domain-containing protein n=1 Tax=Meloidogyne javanica TaxID=6303 RepID=A0A915N0K7_MELJA
WFYNYTNCKVEPWENTKLWRFFIGMMLGSNNCPKAGSDLIKFKGGKALQIVFIRINVDDDQLLNLSGMPFMQGYFKHWIKLKPGKTNRTRFWQTVSTVTRSKYEMLLHKIKTQGDPLLQINMSQRKPQMLMSLEQMVTSKFPFPSEYFGEQLCNETIRSTRKIYHQVSETSPIFTFDCEMCQTSIQQLELTRISVNEDGETVMDELVKPHNKIINYITFKSGITEKMLLNVFDIQHRLCTLLPADAILCGHSLENDLRALQLSHPYCIDTSLLFNFSGRLHIRSGLKALSKIFLNEDIQDSSKGHCSLQDALATWKLLKLKIEKGYEISLLFREKMSFDDCENAKEDQQIELKQASDTSIDYPLMSRETTTISTIAVRAEPHSTLVVALLKSINYVDFRIDEMQPGLLEIGKNPQDNTQLLLIHTDLFQRLLEKHQQVDDLLARAEQIASEQTEVSDVIVYEAMANGLATAWRELGELTSEGMSVGSNLITQIRLLGSLSDNDQRPRETYEACLRIEKVMLKMAESWELLNEACSNLKNSSEQPQLLPSHITQTIESKQIQQQITKNFDIEIQKNQLDNAEQWLIETRRMFESMEESKILKTLEEQTKVWW